MRTVVGYEVQRAHGGTGVKEDDAKFERLLADGWEPFAVTSGTSGYVYHFRRGRQASVTESNAARYVSEGHPGRTTDPTEGDMK